MYAFFQNSARINNNAVSDISESKSAIVVGAGFGGMAAALRLKAFGFNVTLIDRMPRLGGRAQVFTKNGFTYDAGPTVITAPFLFEELFSLFDEDMYAHVDLRPVDPWYRIIFSDGKSFDYGGSISDTLNEIKRFDPRDRNGYLRLLEMSRKIYDVGFTDLSDKPFHRFADMVAQIPRLIRLPRRLAETGPGCCTEPLAVDEHLGAQLELPGSGALGGSEGEAISVGAAFVPAGQFVYARFPETEERNAEVGSVQQHLSALADGRIKLGDGLCCAIRCRS